MPQTPASDTTPLLSADSLLAYYFRDSEQLLVFAAGTTADTTTDIRIDELSWPGALKFAVHGEIEHWAGFKFYTALAERKITLPNKALPGDVILVEDAEHPGGQAVKIKFLGPYGK